MRNAVLPNYDFGHINFELQILNETLQSSISGVCLDNKHEAVENFPCFFNSSFLTYQSPAFQTNTSTTSFEGDKALLSKILAPQLDVDFPTTRNSRKRVMEVNDMSPECGIEEQQSQNKRRSKGPNISVLIESPNKLEMPTRKSQKLADKITALQKLVSPYGKTDTASVLQEASIYIKLLQEQIQNLFRMLSSSCDGISVHNLQESGKRQVELSSRGLCLVPISFTHKLKLESQIDHKYQRY